MALVQDLLNKYKQDREGQYSILLNPQRPDAPEDLPSVPVESQLAIPAQAPAAEPIAPTNKWGYSDSEMSNLAKAGYTPDKLDYYAGEYDPSKHGSYLQRIYESSATAPTMPDERQINKARLISGIGDALGLIGQMVSVGRGAHARERDYNSSALGRTEAKERDLRNIYRQERSAYENGRYNARQRDFLSGMEEYNAGRKGIRDVLDTNRKFEEAARQADAKMRLSYAQLLQKQANEDRNFGLKEQAQKNLEKHRAEINARGWASLGHNKEKGLYGMAIAANPDDPQAQDDQFGGKVRVYQMTKGDIDRLFGEALRSDDFKATYPQYNRQSGLTGETPKSFTAQEKVDIANAYAKMMYDNQWRKPSSPYHYRGWLDEKVGEYRDAVAQPDEFWDQFDMGI